MEKEALPRKLLRIITLNGLLLPGFLLHTEPVFQVPGFKARFKEVYRYRAIYYADTPEGDGKLNELDRLEALRCLREGAGIALELLLGFGNLRKAYRDGLPDIMSADFWRGVYSGRRA
jgi:hypothetical protein